MVYSRERPSDIDVFFTKIPYLSIDQMIWVDAEPKEVKGIKYAEQENGPNVPEARLYFFTDSNDKANEVRHSYVIGIERLPSN